MGCRSLELATEESVIRKAAWRLIPFMGILYLLAFLDRVNVGFAALTMNGDLGLSSFMYGVGAGVFFIGYVLCAVPSNLLLHRVGARRWIGTVMVVWGITSASMAFIRTPSGYCLLRFTLGVAESGFFPGMVLYLTYWFPKHVHARILATFMIALPLSGVIGAPLSAALLDVNALGLRGWQWMFLLEGTPAVIAGVFSFLFLADGPNLACWLSAQERRVLGRALESPGILANQANEEFAHPRVMTLALSSIYFTTLVALYGYGFWVPQFIQASGTFTYVQLGWIVAIPNVAAMVAMYFWAQCADLDRKAGWQLSTPLALAAVGMAVSALVSSPDISVAGLVLAAAGTYASLPVFWSLATRYMTGKSAVVGIAVINSVGNIGGYVGPSVLGYLREAGGGKRLGLAFLASSLFVGALLAFGTSRFSE